MDDVMPRYAAERKVSILHLTTAQRFSTGNSRYGVAWEVHGNESGE